MQPSLVFILPRNIWPPYAGQSRLCFYRAKELKKKGYKLILIYFCTQNNFNNANEKILKSIQLAFKNTFGIEEIL